MQRAATRRRPLKKGNLNATIGATGNVRALQTAILSWGTTVNGTIGSIDVQPGDKVKNGAALASVDLPAMTRSTLESNLLSAQQQLADMTSPIGIANAKLAVTSAQADIVDAQIALNNLNYWQNQGLKDYYWSNLVIAKDKLGDVQGMYDSLNVGEYINNPNEAQAYKMLYAAQKDYDNAKYYYSVYSQKPPQRRIDEAQAKLDLANATLEEANNYLAAITGGEVPENATGSALLKFKQAKLAVQIAQENLDAATLSAPFDGTVTDVGSKVGDQVTPGTAAFRIDDLSHLYVEVQVSEVDINSVEIGQPATISFDAILGNEYNGKVVEVAQSASVASGVVNFDVTVELTDADGQVKPGMTAAVTVTIQSLENVLLIPNRTVRLVNGQRVVYVLRNGILEEIPVELGASDNTNSVLISGALNAGDALVINPPLNFQPGQNGGRGAMFGGG